MPNSWFLYPAKGKIAVRDRTTILYFFLENALEVLYTY